MPLRETGAGDEYSPWVNFVDFFHKQTPAKVFPFPNDKIKTFFCWQIGLVFIFNLIVGTGALTLPAVFAKAGWCLGLILIIVLAFISYMTVTFVIETMACANAVIHWRRLQFLKRDRVSGAFFKVKELQNQTFVAY